MHCTAHARCLEQAHALIAAGARSGQRKILGIVAPPGAGKSTLAQSLKQALGAQAQLLPMDGFHLSNAQLQRLGRSDRKGAADTFDVAGYAQLLQRVRRQKPDETIYAPDFRREVDEAVAAAIAIDPATPLVITEGNYLLHPNHGWLEIRQHLDVVWYLDIDDQTRQQQLLERHMRHGRDRATAIAWIAQTDEPNAMQVKRTRSQADWIIAQRI
jgi:pantothenate kinase